LTGEGMRIGKIEQQAAVDGARVAGFEIGQGRVARLRRLAGQRKSKGQQIAARDADDADTTTAGSRGDGGDGVGFHVTLWRRWQPCRRLRSCALSATAGRWRERC